MIVIKITVVTEVVIMTSFNKNTLTPRQPTNSQCSFSQLFNVLRLLTVAYFFLLFPTVSYCFLLFLTVCSCFFLFLHISSCFFLFLSVSSSSVFSCYLFSFSSISSSLFFKFNSRSLALIALAWFLHVLNYNHLK